MLRWINTKSVSDSAAPTWSSTQHPARLGRCLHESPGVLLLWSVLERCSWLLFSWGAHTFLPSCLVPSWYGCSSLVSSHNNGLWELLHPFILLFYHKVAPSADWTLKAHSRGLNPRKISEKFSSNILVRTGLWGHHIGAMHGMISYAF